MKKNPCEGNAKNYLHYNCYNTLYEYFKKLTFSTTDEDNLEKTKTELQMNTREYSAYNNHFKKLATFLNGNHAFIEYTRVPSCIYINYWLNKNIQEEHNSLYNEKSFDIFKEFTHTYSKIKYNNENNSCREYIKLLNPIEYHRMGILNTLYNLYDLLGSSVYHNYPHPPCTFVSLLAREYRDIFSSPETYKDLFNQLKSLKDLIVKRELHLKLECPTKFSQITLPKEDTHNSVGHNVEKDTKVSLSVPSETDSTGLQGKNSDSRTITEVTLPLSTNLGQTELNQPEKPATGVTIENQHLVTAQEPAHYLGRTPEEEVHGETQHAQYRRLPEASFTEQRVDDPYNTLNVFSYQRPHHVDIHTHPEKSMSPTSQSEDVGVMTNIQNAFSSIVQNVDPAPVLGVSGGMGVLFVLFKYTPFGSFFGGRRGRFRQIPSSFRGFQPDFANFQEYEGGHIGYGPININPLAE
ncbi:variable surface protein Vir6, putative [Plasmodium vivax]|uniref:Variable surface protein Vir6, putative n=1 Tax=Plasmodium vivax (strain Salvador I) TaxID=126793 RepID=A5KCZ6_PLAVS|nr:variable surface protein Vir6, putative [Plasmodium vivax]EDL42774.1 variable surface protein Vir6, putative [Plasmodium vivax]|eukprot:XP_001612567.1 variable surface protein Vir6 [Plasmodium vivax Sal-1]